MNPMDLIFGILQFLGGIPAVGPVLATIVTYALPAVAVITALVALWHAIVVCIGALAVVPGLQGLAGLAAKLSGADLKVDGFVKTYVLPFLNRLSMLPLPTKKQ